MVIRRSIRKQLVLWLAVPLGLLWVISTVAAYFLALSFANEAYDRELINSAYSVITRIRIKNEQILVDLPPAAQAILKFDHEDKFFYRVLKENGEKISGDSMLPPPPHDLKEGVPRFRTVKLGQEAVRLSEIKILLPEADKEPILVQAAETVHSRQSLSTQIFMSIVFPQFLMVLLGATAVWVGVSRGLAPLQFLQKAVASRSHLDLSPVDTNIAPEEAYPLVTSINDLLSRLRDDIKAQQRFVANASHQLRTPLAGLKTYSSVGLGMTNLNEIKDVLKKIDSGLDRTSHLVSQLLTLARNDPGATAILLDMDVDLNFVVSDVIADRFSTALKKKIDLGFEVTGVIPTIKGDATSIQQLVSNILDNALLYTPEEGRINVRLRTTKDNVILEIADTGPGIPQEERDKVFERFYRVEGSPGSGSGLGLAIVQEVAKTHNAQIYIDSNDHNQGTLFTVCFTG